MINVNNSIHFHPNEPIDICNETPENKLKFISELCIDYDGYRDIPGLMSLIDEIRDICDGTPGKHEHVDKEYYLNLLKKERTNQ